MTLDGGKNLLKRAQTAAKLHQTRECVGKEFSVRFCDLMSDVGVYVGDCSANLPDEEATFSCATCGKCMQTAKGIAVHNYRHHGTNAREYRYARGSVCQACLLNCQDSTRLQRHLKQKKECLAILEQSDLEFPELERQPSRTAFKPLVQSFGPLPWWATLKPSPDPPQDEAALPSDLALASSLLNWIMHVDAQSCTDLGFCVHELLNICWPFVKHAPQLALGLAHVITAAADHANDVEVEHALTRASVVVAWIFHPGELAELVRPELGIRARRLANSKWLLLDCARLDSFANLQPSPPKKGHTVLMPLCRGRRHH